MTHRPDFTSYVPSGARRRLLTLLLGMSAVSFAACVAGERAEPEPAASQPSSASAAQASAGAAPASKEARTGRATYISDRLNGQKTASGEIYDGTRLVAAHPRYPLGTRVRVTNPENGRTVDVEVIDRSASGANRPIIDLSRAAAERLDIVQRGVATVRVDVIEWGPRGPR
jgi:rare lipoprotein A